MGKNKKKRRNSTSSASPSAPSDDERKLRKLKKKLKKEKRRSEKLQKKKLRAEKKISHKSISPRKIQESLLVDEAAADIPVGLMERSKAMAPMTKEEWEKRQSVIRKVYDEDSGRYRLIKGDGEIIESIVSRETHKKINQQATQADGAYFQANFVVSNN